MYDSTIPTSSRDLPAEWQFRLYIAGQTPLSLAALARLKQYCNTHLSQTTYAIEVVDLMNNPELAEQDEIIVVPTLVRLTPAPVKRVVGDLSDTQRVVEALHLIQ